MEQSLQIEIATIVVRTDRLDDDVIPTVVLRIRLDTKEMQKRKEIVQFVLDGRAGDTPPTFGSDGKGTFR